MASRSVSTYTKNKGNLEDCIYYRPICLAQIIYKIWPQLVTQKLAKILHIITDQNQYGSKENLFTIDAIIMVGGYIKNATGKSQILLMDISKASDTVNMPLIWTTL